jgi:carbamoyl-phosphate synthase small subunit
VKAILVLEDGTVFEGEGVGKVGACLGEVVFNTSMTGYQEILTDPSYRGQIVTFTYPLIGNYGANPEDFESSRTQVEGVAIRELCDLPSNWRSVENINAFLARNNIAGIAGIDTRALTRRLRTQGVMMGAISVGETPEQVLARLRAAPRYDDRNFVREVSTLQPYQWHHDWRPGRGQAEMTFGGRTRVVVIDYGAKFNILRLLTQQGHEVVVVPCTSTAEEVLAFRPNGVVLSPGPGDPALLSDQVRTIEKLLGKVPILGICLGHQLLGWALGGKTFKLKFGHRGANNPVQDVANRRVYITAQNHGYSIDEDSIKSSGGRVTQINLNDGTVEGVEHVELGMFSLQYHPEASPGPQDNRYSFDRFSELMTTWRPS